MVNHQPWVIVININLLVETHRVGLKSVMHRHPKRSSLIIGHGMRQADTFEAALLQAPEKHWFLKRLVLGRSRQYGEGKT